jgi:hypothetical protein
MNTDVLCYVLDILVNRNDMRSVIVCGMTCTHWHAVTQHRYQHIPQMFVYCMQNTRFANRVKRSIVRVVRKLHFRDSGSKNILHHMITHIPNGVNRMTVHPDHIKRVCKIAGAWLHKYFRNEQDLHIAITALCNGYRDLLYHATFSVGILNKIIYLYIIIESGTHHNLP